jgi:hypothetical protein
MRSGWLRALVACCLPALLAALSWALSASTIVIVTLKDGRTIEAREAVRLGDTLQIRLPGGDILSFAESAVAAIELRGSVRESAPERAERSAAPGEEGGDPDIARESERPKTLSGPEPDMPSAAEQRGALGEAARFPGPMIDPHWQPESGWTELNDANMKPHEWSEPIIDPAWTPESAFDEDADVLASGRTEWSKPPIDPHWQPTDAFGR